MSRYEIQEAAGGTRRVVDTDSGLVITGIWDDGTLAGEGLDAEADIIAFALNAVAEGKNLYARPRVFRGRVPYESEQYHRYEGPTEGVAP